MKFNLFGFLSLLQQRGSIFSEWEIPYEQLQFEKLIGKSDVCEVYKGKWHGKVTIKKFFLPNATRTQLNKFQLEVRVWTH